MQTTQLLRPNISPNRIELGFILFYERAGNIKIQITLIGAYIGSVLQVSFACLVMEYLFGLLGLLGHNFCGLSLFRPVDFGFSIGKHVNTCLIFL